MTTENPTKLTFDVERITPRMMVDFKRETGVEVMGLIETGIDLATLDALLLAGLIWLALRMGDRPDATFDDALDTPFVALDFGDEEAADADPTSAGNAA